MSRRRLIVISGPSGSGKTTVIQRLLREPGLRRAITATTRTPRPGEVNGVSYHFKTREEMQRLIAEGALIEWAEVHGQIYGTPKSELDAKDGSLTLVDIDVQGFRSVQKTGIPTLGIFVAPPSLDTLRERLEKRGTETKDQLERRLANAKAELSAQNEYDFVVINDEVEAATASILRLIREVTRENGGSVPTPRKNP